MVKDHTVVKTCRGLTSLSKLQQLWEGLAHCLPAPGAAHCLPPHLILVLVLLVLLLLFLQAPLRMNGLGPSVPQGERPRTDHLSPALLRSLQVHVLQGLLSPHTFVLLKTKILSVKNNKMFRSSGEKYMLWGRFRSSVFQVRSVKPTEN